MNKKLILAISTLTLLSGCSQAKQSNLTKESNNVSSSIPIPKQILYKDAEFKDNFFSSKSVEFNILTNKIIKPGKPGNENGSKAIIQFWFEVKNNSEHKFTPTAEWLHIFKVTQGDNNLTVYPTTNKNIKNDVLYKGEKAVYGLAFELEDDKTPVKLTAEFENKIIGEELFELE